MIVFIPGKFLPTKWIGIVCTNSVPSVCNFTPSILISTLLPNILVLAGVIFFALILFGGFGMIVGAGKEANPQSAAKSKAAVTYGLVGFLLVISAFFILQIIETITGVDFINPGI